MSISVASIIKSPRQFRVPNFGRMDTAQNAFFQNKLRFIVQNTYDVLYPPRRYREILPINTSIPEGFLSYDYGQYDERGSAGWISDAADDLSSVDMLLNEFTERLHPLGDSYQYDLFEIDAARIANVDLNGKRALVARNAIDRKLELVARLGDTGKKLKGFFNNADVPLVSLTNDGWLTATADQILADLNELLQSIIDTTDDVENPDKLVVSSAIAQRLRTLRIGDVTSQTVAEFFLATNGYINEILVWPALKTADAAGTGHRVIMFKKDPQKVEMLVPVPFKQLPPQERNLAFVVNCYAITGGVVFYYPKSAAYADIQAA